MKIVPTDPPRDFEVGRGAPVRLRDCARIELDADEQVTFVTADGSEYDVVRKAWGFYATPSLNGRLRQFGLRAVLVRCPRGRFYVMLVEAGREADFQRYLDTERHAIVAWLDTDADLDALARAAAPPAATSQPNG